MLYDEQWQNKTRAYERKKEDKLSNNCQKLAGKWWTKNLQQNITMTKLLLSQQVYRYFSHKESMVKTLTIPSAYPG